MLTRLMGGKIELQDRVAVRVEAHNQKVETRSDNRSPERGKLGKPLCCCQVLEQRNKHKGSPKFRKAVIMKNKFK